VLITAGPTHEPIDRVRYIGNRSSGRMGIALAEACAARGWPATLLLGPVAIPPPQHSHLSVLRFQTAADLQRLLWEHWPGHDLLLMAAAVADYTVAGVAGAETRAIPQKIKRAGDRLTLELVPTPDLLASLSPITRANQTVVGFALEPAADLVRESLRKLEGKRLDAIVANPLATMDSPDVSATLILADGTTLPAPANASKTAFASWLLDRLADSILAGGG
jgi:phosphopantothenoylcysteine decarboxylase/phosphopantothenate--cysteine ligase